MPSTLDEVTRHKLSVDDYHIMGEAGLFKEGQRIELINGEIFSMPPLGPPHISIVNQLTKRLVHAVGDSAIVSVQNPVQLGDLSEPEPDLCLLRSEETFYAKQIAQAKDILLIIEVADSSLAFDKNTKARLYAGHGVCEYWLFDVLNKQIHIYRQPQSDGYAEILTLKTPGSLCPHELPDVTIDMSGLV